MNEIKNFERKYFKDKDPCLSELLKNTNLRGSNGKGMKEEKTERGERGGEREDLS